MTLTSSDVLLFLTGLLTLFCPPVAIPMYAAVTGHFPDATQRQIAFRLFAWIAALMVGAVWGGQFLLRMLGLTLGALTLTGGLVLCLWSIPMMRGTANDERSGGDTRLEYAQWRNYIAVPLIFPLSIGSAVMSLVITTATRFHAPADLLTLSAACVLHAGVIGLTYACSASWCRRLGEIGRTLVERLSGIVLTAIAFQMLAQGVRELLPGLAH
ncbi:MarC family protein [Burkholderia catarinensis]|uniref:MarC family protein n=1 Tax=Burkholderia catarinensis TaxID=1108140 RepID=UPI000917139E|nr:MarC family protein [Burkholderia catarinensis]KAG8155506.1 antibiotic resistance protein MarC [Burkholderia catarinensis]